MNILTCWIGQTDLNAAAGDDKAGIGPIANAVAAQKYDVLCLLNNYPVEKSDSYVAWLRPQSSAQILLRQISLSSPTAYGEIIKLHCVRLKLFSRSIPKQTSLST